MRASDLLKMTDIRSVCYWASRYVILGYRWYKNLTSEINSAGSLVPSLCRFLFKKDKARGILACALKSCSRLLGDDLCIMFVVA